MTRVNRAIELLEQGQPVYYTQVTDLSHASGVRHARTWADYLAIDLEHHPFDIDRLLQFMRGLVAGGPTASGHRTPAVIVTQISPGAQASSSPLPPPPQDRTRKRGSKRIVHRRSEIFMPAS